MRGATGGGPKDAASFTSFANFKPRVGRTPDSFFRSTSPRRGAPGFSLVEMIVSLALAGIFITGVVSGYMQSVRQAEWSAYTLAANSLAMQELERSRAAKWDPLAVPAVDQVVSSNFPVRVEILDIPISGTNIVYATNRVTVSTISTTPPLKMIRVDCSWSFPKRGVFTNSVYVYRAPDQ